MAALRASARSHGFLYLRGEYRYLLEPLSAVLARRRAAGLLGRTSAAQPGFDFDIEIHLGAGAYVCGEESALIESLEGKRGMPRNRPPYPVSQRLPAASPPWSTTSRPSAPRRSIAVHGGDWFARHRHAQVGRHQDPSPCPATARAPASTSIRSASRVRAGAGRLRRARHVRRCRSAARRAPASTPASSTAASPSRTCRPPAPSWCSTRARHVRGGAQLHALLRPRKLRLLHALPRRHVAADATSMDKHHRGHGLAARPATRSCTAATGCCRRQPLRPRAHRVQPAARHPAAVPPRLRAAPAVARLRAGFDLDGALARARQMTGRDDAGAHLATRTHA